MALANILMSLIHLRIRAVGGLRVYLLAGRRRGTTNV
jgi:hypothetical protein